MSRGWNGLQPFSRKLYEETYFIPGEDYEGWLRRVSSAYANDSQHADRMATYIRNYHFHPSTPISSNAGTDRGLPISCFTKKVYDNKPSIFKNYNESFNLGAFGGGIGTGWSDVREVNHPVGVHGGSSSGLIPFLGISDRSTLAISQGGLRRASEAAYLHISHPEIEEFIDLRLPTGDQNRRAPNLHHGIAIPDAFMIAMEARESWDLISPKSGEVVKTVDAYDLWCKILEVRATIKGEPYLLFIDTVNRLSPDEYKIDEVEIEISNLCTEIMLRTDDKHSGVCCLGSVNAEYYDEWKGNIDQFIADCSDYLDNVLQAFIVQTEDLDGFERARAGAIDERSIGLGLMGLHSYYQKNSIPWESMMAKSANIRIFSSMKKASDDHQVALDSPCPMAIRTLSHKRNIHVFAVAPTMSISSLCDLASSGIEPWLANTFVKKVKQGTFAVRNKFLTEVIEEESIDHDYKWLSNQWESIKKHDGSVQHLEWMSDWDKEVFKTAHEIDQRYIIEQAADRTPFICQGQSVNIFLPANSHVRDIYGIHVMAWKKGVKSLYYLRSTASSRASTSSGERKTIEYDDDCLACQ